MTKYKATRLYNWRGDIRGYEYRGYYILKVDEIGMSYSYNIYETDTESPRRNDDEIVYYASTLADAKTKIDGNV